MIMKIFCRLNIFGTATVLLMASSAVTASPEVSNHINKKEKFKITCDMHGRIIFRSHPNYTGTYPANQNRWAYIQIINVDLAKKIYCDMTECKKHITNKINYIGKTRVFLLNKDNIRLIFIKKERRLFEEVFDEGTVSVTSGLCRVGPFSDFPALRWN